MELEREVGGYTAAALVDEEVNQVYRTVADLIHAEPSEIALVESATVAWTRAFYSMAEKQQRDATGTGNANANVILISDAEYAANVVAACQWARDKKWTVLSIPSVVSDGKSTGIVDLKALDEMLSGNYTYKDEEGKSVVLDPSRIALACITHIPTNSGIVNPVEEIGQRILAYNNHSKQGESSSSSRTQILYLVDACQSVGQLPVNAQNIQCHALVATGRKYLRGPRGTGFLFVSSEIVNELMPSHIDHYGVPVSRVPASYEDGDAVQNLLEYAPREGATRFEFYEANVANRLGLGAAITEAIRKGTKTIEEDCGRLAKLVRERLDHIPSIIIHHKSSASCGIVTFYSTAMDSKTIKEKMQTEGFELSVVPATSTPLDSSKLKVPDLVRASCSYTNTEDEIDAFSQALASLLE
jgi:selenocysteine lyase/cysteine desulfurase